MTSLRWKVILPLLLIMLVVSGVGLAHIEKSRQRHIQVEIEERILPLAHSLHHLISSLTDDSILQRFVLTVGAERWIERVAVVGGSDRRVISDTMLHNVGRHWREAVDLPITEADLRNMDLNEAIRASAMGPNIVEYISHTRSPLGADQSLRKEDAWVVIDYDTSGIREAARSEALSRYLLLFGGAITGCGLLYFLINRVILIPIFALNEVLIARSRGEPRRFEAESKDELGRLGAGFNEMFDYIDASQAQLSLKNEALDQAVLDLSTFREAINSSCIMDEMDGEFRILNVNDAFCDVSGYSRGEILGQTHAVWRSNEHNRGGFEEMHAALGRGETWHGEICNRRKDGSLFWLDSTIVPVKTGEGASDRYLALRIDITDRKLIQSDMESAREKAEAANRAKSVFLATMSHEIRTPLNAVIGMSTLLGETELDDYQRECAQTIAFSGSSLLELINDILDLSKIESGNMTFEKVAVDLTELVERVVKILTERASARGNELNWTFAESLPSTFIGDAARIQQILINLVGNAVKFTENGQVTIAVSGKARPKSRLFDLRFEVKDTGIGIKKENLHRLFSDFVQAEDSTTRRFGGTGLGLSISRKLGRLMGGDVTATSVWEQGSNFKLSLPLEAVSDDTGEGVAVPNQGREQFKKSGGRASCFDSEASKRWPLSILVMEDNKVNQRVLGLMLERFGYIAEYASDGQEGLQKVLEQSYDLVLLDIEMPVMSGLEAATRIRAELSADRQPYLAALTANLMNEKKQQCLDAGMDDCLPKPIVPDHLLQAFEQAHAAAQKTSSART